MDVPDCNGSLTYCLIMLGLTMYLRNKFNRTNSRPLGLFHTASIALRLW